jgi:hypothetical protein
MTLESDKNSSAAGASSLCDEIRNLVTERVDLNSQMNIEVLLGPELNNSVEDRLPVFVAREIVVADEVVAHALPLPGANQLFNVIRASKPGFTALNIDDCAEAATERTSAARVEGTGRTQIAVYVVLRQKR